MTDEERKKLNRPFQKSVWQTWKGALAFILPWLG